MHDRAFCPSWEALQEITCCLARFKSAFLRHHVVLGADANASLIGFEVGNAAVPLTKARPCADAERAGALYEFMLSFGLRADNTWSEWDCVTGEGSPGEGAVLGGAQNPSFLPFSWVFLVDPLAVLCHLVDPRRPAEGLVGGCRQLCGAAPSRPPICRVGTRVGNDTSCRRVKIKLHTQTQHRQGHADGTGSQKGDLHENTVGP